MATWARKSQPRSRHSNLPELGVASFSDLRSLACMVKDYEPREGFPGSLYSIGTVLRQHEVGLKALPTRNRQAPYFPEIKTRPDEVEPRAPTFRTQSPESRRTPPTHHGHSLPTPSRPGDTYPGHPPLVLVGIVELLLHVVQAAAKTGLLLLARVVLAQQDVGPPVG